MVKVVNKIKKEILLEDIPVGECFLYRGELFMRVRHDSRYHCLRIESGCIQTNFHGNERVLPVNITIEVEG